MKFRSPPMSFENHQYRNDIPANDYTCGSSGVVYDVIDVN